VSKAEKKEADDFNMRRHSTVPKKTSKGTRAWKIRNKYNRRGKAKNEGRVHEIATKDGGKKKRGEKVIRTSRLPKKKTTSL